MNGKDKISVIIPCYNVQKYIMRCFDSIYSQTYGFENLEVILIDDLSTDNTWSILESLQRKYPENVISLKIQKKGKCGGARNLGMDICMLLHRQIYHICGCRRLCASGYA